MVYTYVINYVLCSQTAVELKEPKDYSSYSTETQCADLLKFQLLLLYSVIEFIFFMRSD